MSRNLNQTFSSFFSNNTFIPKSFISYFVFFISLKLIVVAIMAILLPLYFDRSIFKMMDFYNYILKDEFLGPNLLYRYFLITFEIQHISDYFPIFLAIVLNTIIDIAWIRVLFKLFQTKIGLWVFLILFALHPYLSIYFMQFSTILFMKIGIFLFYCRINYFSNYSIKYEILFSILILILCLFRNQLVFVAVPFYLIHSYKLKKIYPLFSSLMIASIVYFSSGNYLDLVSNSIAKYSWNIEYIQRLSNYENIFILFLILLISKIFILFGSREKVFVEGIEPFFGTIVGEFQIICFVLLALFHLFGFAWFLKSFNSQKKLYSLSLVIPLFISVFSIAHMRYLIPYIPLCICGFILLSEKFLIIIKQ